MCISGSILLRTCSAMTSRWQAYGCTSRFLFLYSEGLGWALRSEMGGGVGAGALSDGTLESIGGRVVSLFEGRMYLVYCIA